MIYNIENFTRFMLCMVYLDKLFFVINIEFSKISINIMY